ncbi:unnamed protein product [Effrenium voratum]|uniref:Uncharacterized protein n=1 Tax=Effrenium voratum TaxID=2562239 RepID=A0AA36J3C7_9DINO|nr:unnamed protein product [Effrenium voratum]
MVDIKHPRCNCGRAQPAFGMLEDVRASCCAQCKLEGMVDIRNPRCNCGRARPYFGMPKDASPSCCAECKLEGMVDIRSRRCICGRAIPCFGMPEDARASCCAKCKLEGMVDILHPKCSVCGTRASYPDAAGVPRQLCAAHSAEVGAHVLSLPSWSRAASDCLDKALTIGFVAGLTKKPAHGLGRSLPAWSQIERFGLMHMTRSGVRSWSFLGITTTASLRNIRSISASLAWAERRPRSSIVETFERLDLFLEQNLRVFYVWEHEFTEWQKLAATGEAPPMSRILRRHTQRSWKARRTARKRGQKAAAAKRHAG